MDFYEDWNCACAAAVEECAVVRIIPGLVSKADALCYPKDIAGQDSCQVARTQLWCRKKPQARNREQLDYLP